MNVPKERSGAVEKTRIAAEKQALRDVTDEPEIDAATTVDMLKLIRLA